MNFKELFELIKIKKFLQKYTGLNLTSGILVRINGKGTSPLDKRTECTPEEKKAIKAGLQNYIKDLQRIEKSIK